MRYIFTFLTLCVFLRSNGQDPGDNFFATNQVHEIYITFQQVGYWDSLVANYTTGTYMKAGIVIDGVSYPEVGVKFKGNSSYNNPSDKKPFKIDMNEYVAGQDIDGLKKFNLNNNFKDPSFLRERLTLDFYNDHGLHAPRAAFAKVYLNNVYWGVYNFIEEVDVKQFLVTHFNDDDGNMFKGDPHGDLRWLGSNASSYYTEYELHTNETANDWSDLLELIDDINNTGANFQDSLETSFNTTAWIKQWAVLNIFSNMDSYIGSGHNYYIYHDSASNKFEWVAWDVNESFGSFRQNLTAAQVQTISMFYISNANNKPLAQKMLNVPAYKDLLINTICQWVQYDFSNAALDSKIDSYANLIRPAVYADVKKTTTNQQFETNLTTSITMPGPGGEILGLKSFITNRRNALVAELANNGCVLNVNDIQQAGQLKVYPNPANGYLSIEVPVSTTLELLDISGRRIALKQATQGYNRLGLDDVADGIYYLRTADGACIKVVLAR